jgi:hypothetical protein
VGCKSTVHFSTSFSTTSSPSIILLAAVLARVHTLVKTAQIPRFRSRIVGVGRAQNSETVCMAFEAILREVDHLHNVSTRLEALAEHHPLMSEPLITIAGNVRNAATVLAVLIATKGPKPI